ncbi:DNA-directed RNA polymerase I subunit RPA12-like [Babylonia areolata]|uniref:DNA-directed RNA polymerase I subunit RPA12-like n=1 Tax=Babylonia areolata TaxID=304850 RepID=UPI003FD6176B
MASKKIFLTDPEFCPDCGTILPVPGITALVVCPRCGFSVPKEAFYGLERKSVIAFNKPKDMTERHFDIEAPTGPKVDRKCKECGHEEMTYSTRQTRSADEGQTVFYCCVKCKAVETEYS